MEKARVYREITIPQVEQIAAQSSLYLSASINNRKSRVSELAIIPMIDIVLMASKV